MRGACGCGHETPEHHAGPDAPQGFDLGRTYTLEAPAQPGVGGAKFRRQFGVGPYILDFYCAEALLAVELDGDVHGQPQQERHDRRRDQFVADLGIKVLRYWNEELRANLDGVLEEILRTVQQKTTPPHLDPLPCGERRPEVK